MIERTAVWIGGLALVFYLLGAGWGVPAGTSADAVRKWGVDDESPLGPLAQVANILEPKEVQNLGYPLMHSFLAVAASAPYLGWKWVTGQWRSPSGEYPYGFADPAGALRVLSIIANILSAVMAVGIVWCAYDIGRQFAGELAGRLAAGFTAVSYPIVYYARTGNVDVPMMCFVALGLAAYARSLQHGFTVRRALALGASVGCAVATKEPAAAAFLGVPLVLLVLHAGVIREHGVTARAAWLPFVAAAVACGVAFGIGSGLLVDPDRFRAHLDFISSRVGEASSGQVGYLVTYPRTWAGNLALTRHLFGYVVDSTTALGLVLAIGGGVALLRRRAAAVWLAVPAVTYYGVLFWTARIGQLRYLLPVSFVVIIFAAVAVTNLYQTGVWGRRVAVTAAGFILGIGGLRAIDLTYEMMFDSRYAARDWLAAHTHAGEQAAFFGADQKLPALPVGVRPVRAARYEGAVGVEESGFESADTILARWRETAPAVVIIMPDHSSRSGDFHSATCPPELFAKLVDGTAGYTLAATFHTPRLLPWLPRPDLDYPSVNPPIRVFAPSGARGPEPEPA